ncbi:hypothetical protein DB346_07520 [Verrucomicrobia bacterium LW23]|nr:hypothetical protein DB346_07520 [Verrucomicrobia bacterium LW23]
MAIDVTTLLQGPAIVRFGGATFYSRGEITLSVTHRTVDVETDRFGKVDERVLDSDVRVRFTPAGEWEALGVLFPWLAVPVGSYITGAGDSPLVIHTVQGTRITLHNAAVTRMPTIRGSTRRPLLGEVEFTAFTRNNTARSAAAARYTVDSAPLSDASFNPQAVVMQPYTLAWGASAPWDAMATRDGFTLEWSLGLSPVETDRDGVVTQQITRLEATARAAVLGVTEADVLQRMLLQGAGADRGRSLADGSDNLVITGDGVHIRLYAAALRSGPQLFGRAAARIGDLEWVASRVFEAGVPGPLAYVGTAAP